MAGVVVGCGLRVLVVLGGLGRRGWVAGGADGGGWFGGFDDDECDGDVNFAENGFV